MFAKTIVFSDAFLDMPLSARCLYFTLGMVADDDGFVNNPKSVMRQCGAQEDDLKILLAKRFLIAFDNGVIVIKHWRINNYLQKDRINPTKYVEEKAMLQINENGSYHKSEDAMYTQYVYTQNSIDKNSIDKDSVDDVSPATPRKKKSFVPPSLDEVKAYVKERNSPVDPQKFYDFYTADPDRQWIDSKGNPVRSWKQKILTWEKSEPEKKVVESGDKWGKTEIDVDHLKDFLENM